MSHANLGLSRPQICPKPPPCLVLGGLYLFIIARVVNLVRLSDTSRSRTQPDKPASRPKPAKSPPRKPARAENPVNSLPRHRHTPRHGSQPSDKRTKLTTCLKMNGAGPCARCRDTPQPPKHPPRPCIPSAAAPHATRQPPSHATQKPSCTRSPMMDAISAAGTGSRPAAASASFTLARISSSPSTPPRSRAPSSKRTI